MSKWSAFIKGIPYGPVIRINNASELKSLQELAKKNKMDYYETFCKRGYKEILHILEINSSNEFTFYKNTNRGRSFLVEYSYNGFTFTDLKAYDNCRVEPEEWEIISIFTILNELK